MQTHTTTLRRNRVYKSLHKPLTYLGVERTLFYFVCVGAVGVFTVRAAETYQRVMNHRSGSFKAIHFAISNKVSNPGMDDRPGCRSTHRSKNWFCGRSCWT